MKTKNKFIGTLLFFTITNLTAQTPYFYYYKGEKQYLELDSKHVFVSAGADLQSVPMNL
jgi:hypothetical protein